MTWTPEQRRAWNERNPGRERELKLAFQREYFTINGEQIRGRARKNYRPGRQHADVLRSRHSMEPDDWAAIWDAQDGRCYLCGDELVAEKAVIDHDHSHCPRQRSCPICRRGLAHPDCNSAIGLAGDDVARLRRMVDAMGIAQLAVNERKSETVPGLW